MDETNTYKVFSKSRLEDTKILLEGKGVIIENKFSQPVRGFVGCYIIMTCQELPYPFVPPVNSTSGFEYKSYEI